MLIHIVLLKRKSKSQNDAAGESAALEGLRGLSDHIDVIRSWKLSANEVQRPTCWDWVLESRFDDPEGLDAYLNHPQHVRLLPELLNHFELAVCDYQDRAR